jgi:hypothetical protein
MGIGLLLLAIFLAGALVMFTRALPAVITLPLMGVALVCGAALIDGGISSHDILKGVLSDGALKLHEAMIVSIFGGALSFVMQKSGAAESAVKQGAELVGANPLPVGVVSLLIVALLFTSLGGLGAVIMVSMIVLPMLATVGLSPAAGAAIILFGMSLGGVLNPANWVIYTSLLGVPVSAVKSYALVVFATVMIAGCALIVFELFRSRLVRWDTRFIATLGGLVLLLALVSAALVASTGGEASAEPAAWLVATRWGGLALFALVLLAIARDALTKLTRWRQQEVRVRAWAYLIPVVPLLAILLYDVPILAAFALGLVYAIFATLRPGSLALSVRSLIEGGASVMPAVVLMFGIGILVQAVIGPAGWKQAHDGATWPVLAAIEPVLRQCVPSSPLTYVIGFGLAAPLALYRGPLNVWGLGYGVTAILQSSGVIPPAAIMAMMLSVGQVQGICDPTNTANVWVANHQGVDVQRLMLRTLPFVWGAVFVGLAVAAVRFY